MLNINNINNMFNKFCSKNVWHNDMNAGDMTYTRTETVTRDRFGTDSTGRIYRGTSPLRLTGRQPNKSLVHKSSHFPSNLKIQFCYFNNILLMF